MIKITGKAKLQTIEVNGYVSQLEKIRKLTENLVGLNKNATIEVWDKHLVLHCEMCPFLQNHFKLEKIKDNEYIVH